ncbi:MAG TPA: four helix bundle protein [Armatimonadota bacterium]|jgi:four helix bundle protein
MNDERPEGRLDKTSDLPQRTKRFALSVIRLFAEVPKRADAQVIARQMVRSGTSVGANYREAHRARTTAEFISKLEVVLQELDETAFWFELLIEGCGMPTDLVGPLQCEAEELICITVASVKTAKTRLAR